MRFCAIPIEGAWLVELEQVTDERGFFARSWCRKEFAAHGLCPDLAQCSVSYNRSRGTLRGMHFQAEPHAETKLVRCTAGAIFDVIADVRPSSPSFRRWFGIELSAANRKMLYVPEGCAHGFQTLADDSEVSYQISEFYDPDLARGFHWNDRTFAIQWPLEQKTLSAKDQQLPEFGA